MSGGAYDYAYLKVEEMARQLHGGGPILPHRVKFKRLLELVAEAMRACEWEDSGDGADDKAAIEAVFKYAREVPHAP